VFDRIPYAGSGKRLFNCHTTPKGEKFMLNRHIVVIWKKGGLMILSYDNSIAIRKKKRLSVSPYNYRIS